MAEKKTRASIPKPTAAQVLFYSDRICCVCRERGKPVQLHHIDENPANHALWNLAVLCFDCHRNTQLSGGFDRKLDADQVRLYRDDWLRTVKLRRTEAYAETAEAWDPGHEIASITSETEAFRENGEFELLAILYHTIGNIGLRDKYVDVALEGEPSDATVVYLRGLQRRADLIPPDVLAGEEKRLTALGDWTERGRMYKSLERFVDAAKDYLRGINESLEEGNLFSAAFYANRNLKRKVYAMLCS